MADPAILDRTISVEAAVEALGEKGIKISARALRKRARQIGAYRQIGAAMFFLEEDLKRIMEPVCSNSSNAPKARTGSRGEPSKVVGLSEARAKLRNLQRAKH